MLLWLIRGAVGGMLVAGLMVLMLPASPLARWSAGASPTPAPYPPPATPTITPRPDPTLPPVLLVVLTQLTAERDGPDVGVTWTTAVEYNTRGFYIERGATPQRADAHRVSTAMIVARGTGSAMHYRWVDDDPPSGAVWYWLVEIDNGGNLSDHGPVAP